MTFFRRKKPLPRKSQELSKIIAAILCDIAKAQDISNEYSVKLSKKYSENPILENFPVPNGTLTEMEMIFYMAGDEVSIGDEVGPLQEYKAALRDCISDITGELLETLSKKISESKVFDNDDSKAKILGALRGIGWQQYLTDEILDKIGALFKHSSEETVENDLQKKLPDLLYKEIEDNVLHHKDVKSSKPDSIAYSMNLFIKENANKWNKDIVNALKAYKKGFDVPTFMGNIRTIGIQRLNRAIKFKIVVEIKNYIWLVEATEDESQVKVTFKRLVPENS